MVGVFFYLFFSRVEQIKKVEKWLNTYPRKILGYANAEQIFSIAF